MPKYKDSGAQIVKKSNALVSAKYKASLLENKLMGISLTRLEQDGKQVMSRIKPAEIKQILGSENDTNIYKKLKRIAKKMTGHQIAIEDGRGNFKVFSMITNADYIDGEFIITYNKELTSHITELRTNYTTMQLATLVSFTHTYTFRIYELLKKEMYLSDPDIDGGMVRKEYGLNEFRCMIGLVDMDDQRIKDAIDRGESWDTIYEEIAEKKQFSSFGDFKRRVLMPAKEELEEKSDIRFEFTEKSGRGKSGKVNKLVIFIYPNAQSKEKVREIESRTEKIITISESDEYTQESLFTGFILEDLIGHNNLTRDNLETFLQIAGGKEDIVRETIGYVDTIESIDNYVAYIRKCLITGIDKPIKVVHGSTTMAETIQEVKETINSADIRQKVWAKTKEKPDFGQFLEYIGMTIEVFEADFPDISERMGMYSDWRVQSI